MFSPVHIVINTWEPNREVLKIKDNQVDNQSISKYTYGINALRQRSGVDQTGSAFGQSQHIDWGYNLKGEVVGADHSADDGQDRAYQFDEIGNRMSATEGAVTTSYTPNKANQYSEIGNTVPVHDLDGNLTSDGAGATLTWDGENRLVQFEKGGDQVNNAYPAGSEGSIDMKLEFEYRVYDKKVGSTILAKRKGYWVSIKGDFPDGKILNDTGGFDD